MHVAGASERYRLQRGSPTSSVWRSSLRCLAEVLFGPRKEHPTAELEMGVAFRARVTQVSVLVSVSLLGSWYSNLVVC